MSSLARQVARRDGAEVAHERALDILLLSLLGVGCALRRCIARVGAASARSFFFVCGVIKFLVLEDLSFLNYPRLLVARSKRFVRPST
jgi:hypothetical protein